MHSFKSTGASHVIYSDLDSLEAFFVNSYQNGATSWIPKELPPNVRIVVTLNSGPVVTRKGGSGADREVQRFAVVGVVKVTRDR